MANTNTAADAMKRIQLMHDLAPDIAEAFLSGLEAGYTLGLCQGTEKKEGSDK